MECHNPTSLFGSRTLIIISPEIRNINDNKKGQEKLNDLECILAS